MATAQVETKKGQFGDVDYFKAALDPL